MKFLPLSRLFGARRRPRPARPAVRPAAPARTHRPNLEALEERLAPAVEFWNGMGGNNLWSNGSNWVGGVAPKTGDVLVFGTYTPGLGGETRTGTVFNDLTNVPIFQEIVFQTPNWVLQGNPIQLSGNNGLGILSTNGRGSLDPNTPDINIQIAMGLTASQTFQLQNSNSLMFISLLVRINGHTLTLEADGNSVLQINGKLDDPQSVNRGMSTVVKTGIGTVTMAGDNLYAGPTVVQQGILAVQSNTALGPAVGGLVVGGSRPSGTTVMDGASLMFGSSLTGGGLVVAEDLFLAGDGARGLGALINLGSNSFQQPVDNTLVGTINLESSFGETMVNTLTGGTLDQIGGIKQPKTGSQSGAPLVQAFTKIGGGEWIMDGRGPDPFWTATSTPFENLFYTNTYTGDTKVVAGTLMLNKEVRENEQPPGNPPHLLIGSGITGIAADGSYIGGHNLPTDPLLLNNAGQPGSPGGYAILGNLIIGTGVGAPDTARVVTLITEPSRDDPLTTDTAAHVEEIECEEIRDTSTVTVNRDGFFQVNEYGDPWRIQILRRRPLGERISNLTVINGDVVLGVNNNPMQFLGPLMVGGVVASPPAMISAHLLVNNLVMQGGNITGQVATDTADGGPNNVIEGTLMLINGAGITTLANNTPAVINSVLNLGFTTRSDVSIHGTSFPDLIIQGPTGNGGLTLSDSSSQGQIQMVSDNVNLPQNETFPMVLGFDPPSPYPPLNDPGNTDISVNLVSGILLLSNDLTLGTGRLVIFGGSLQSDDPTRTIANPVTIAGDFGVVGAPNLTFTGPVVLNGTHTVTVQQNLTNFATTIGDVQGSTNGLYKAGVGTLLYSGTAANTYLGTTWVQDGVLLLAKTAGVTAVASALYAGDGQGAPGSAVVAVLTNEQIANGTTVVDGNDGSFQIAAGVTETIRGIQSSGVVVLGVGAGSGSSQLNVLGPTTLYGATVTQMGSGGTLQIGSDMRALPGPLGPTSLIATDLLLAGQNVHNLVVDPGALLMITGAMAGASSVYKTGGGSLVYAGGTANTYSGITWVQDGGLFLAKTAGVTAVPLTLYVGDGQGAANSAVVVVTSDQNIPTSTDVAVSGDGLFEIASNVTDFINTLNLAGTLQLDPGSHLFVHQVMFQPGANIIDNSPGGLGAY